MPGTVVLLGPGFSPVIPDRERIGALAPEGIRMPPREPVRQRGQTYFVTFQTIQRRELFRSDRWALLFLEILKHYGDQIELHDFVVMLDHVHLLITAHCTIEKAMQLVKGGYSFRAKRAFKWSGEIWQPGFSDHRIRDEEDYWTHVAYIAKNSASMPPGVKVYCGANAGLPLQPIPQRLKP